MVKKCEFFTVKKTGGSECLNHQFYISKYYNDLAE